MQEEHEDEKTQSEMGYEEEKGVNIPDIFNLEMVWSRVFYSHKRISSKFIIPFFIKTFHLSERIEH